MGKTKAPARREGDLSVTALYTSATWSWARFSCAELFALPEAKAVFRITNAALGLTRPRWLGHPSLRHSLAQRHAMLDRLLSRARPRQVVELAAGLSRRGAAMTQDADLVYTELDLPPVIARKQALLARTAVGQAVAARPGYRLVGGDARTVELGEYLRPGEPAVVVAEGLCMYLDGDARRALFQKVAASLAAGGGTFLFDLVPAAEERPQGWTGRLLERCLKKATDGRSFERDARTREDLAAELRAAGFDAVDVHDGHLVAAEWGLPYPKVNTKIVVFAARLHGR